MGQFGIPLSIVTFVFFFNKKQQMYYSVSSITPRHHLETSPSLLTCPQGYTLNGKNKSKPRPQLLLWKRKGVGLGSPFLQVNLSRRADPSYAQRTGLSPFNNRKRTFKQEQSRFTAKRMIWEGFERTSE